MFQPASKNEAKLRLAITGLSGGGKTWTALEIATYFGGKIAAVDTEHKSMSKYADHFRFDVLDLKPPYHPQHYIDAIQAAEDGGYKSIILDSLTHVWTGAGGIISIVDDIASHSQSHNKFTAWNEGTRLYMDLINAILQSNIHVIGTIRSKQEHVQEKDDKGKTVVKRVGMQPIQRKDFEFEFDVIMAMDVENVGTITKTRCSDLPMGTRIRKPGASMAKTLMEWLQGVEWTGALDKKAVAHAAAIWKVEPVVAYARIQKAVSADQLSATLPKEEFKEYVEAKRQ